MAVQKQLYTIDDFKRFVEQPENADRLFELINGEIIEKMPGRATNSAIHTWIVFFVRLFCREHNLPCFLAAADGAFNIFGHAYAPDFAYTTTPFTGDYPEPSAPLWVVEIISPTDEPGKVRAKRLIYLQAGILYWEIYPDDHAIDVYVPGQPVHSYGIEDIIEVGNVLPNFKLSIKDIFAG